MTPLESRIVDALQAAGGSIEYYALAEKLWPIAQHPKAWRGATKGGPHGWAMPLGRALNELHQSQIVHDGRLSSRRTVRLLASANLCAGAAPGE